MCPACPGLGECAGNLVVSLRVKHGCACRKYANRDWVFMTIKFQGVIMSQKGSENLLAGVQ